MSKIPMILCCVIFVSISIPVCADTQTDEETPNQLFEGATRQIMRALELLVNAIPQYEMPEVLDNGDIIIRKVQPGGREPDTPDENTEEPLETST